MKKRNPRNKNVSRNKLKAVFKENQRNSTLINLFDSFYSCQWGQKRWSSILPAMRSPTRYCCLINRFAEPESYFSISSLKMDQLFFITIPCLFCLDDENVESPFPPPQPDSKNITNYYLLDAASVLVIEALDIQPNDKILDMCSAPGGKAVAIFQHLFFPSNSDNNTDVRDTRNTESTSDQNEILNSVIRNRGDGIIVGGSVVCNDISPARINRLRNTINNYLPKKLRENVSISQRDATNPSAWPVGSFTKVLVDAPCSSERHLLHNPKEFEKWGRSRSRNNAMRQFSILKNALQFVMEDGIVVYVTCSISSLENDGLIEKIVKKCRVEVKVEKKSWLIGEATKYGWMILPDTEGRWGPLYFAVLRKGQLKQKTEHSDINEENDEEDGIEEDKEDEEDSV